MDYYKLGEVAGKAWRLGHMEGDGGASHEACSIALDTLHVPQEERMDFYRGWVAGVEAVDENAKGLSSSTPTPGNPGS